MANLCIIPARGGSRRIPRKNIKAFLGKPIIAYSIENALNLGSFDEVMVSTDDQEIADIALALNAKVPLLRSKENSGHHATTLEVIKEVLDEYRKKGQKFDFVCCLYPTAPTVTTGQLQEGLDILIKNKYHTVFPVTSFSYPIWRGIRINKGSPEMIWPENVAKRSQDLETVYHDAGQWYWLNPMENITSLICDNSGVVILNNLQVQDIDNPIDWQLAELKYKLLHEK
jgi:N-acylneuraminate cytidylyltransferase